LKIKVDDVGRVIAVVASTSLPISPVNPTDIIQDDSDAELSLSFHGVVYASNRVDILRRACDVLPLSNLEFLSVYFPSSSESINWSEIFQHCTEVTTVQVSGHGTIGLLQALTPPKQANTTARGKGRKRKRGDEGRAARAQAANDDDDDDDDDDDNDNDDNDDDDDDDDDDDNDDDNDDDDNDDNDDNDDGLAPVHVPIFPKLTSLLLEVLDFSDEVPGSGILYDLVMGAAQRRRANKTPLTTLCIDKCVISKEQARALEKVVSDFRWDHDEGYRDDDEGDREYHYECDCDREFGSWHRHYSEWEHEW